MGRPNGLDVPEAVVALLAVLPFKVTVWVMRSPGEGDEFEVIKGPCGWGVRATEVGEVCEVAHRAPFSDRASLSLSP
jgi:hypothetical protein